MAQPTCSIDGCEKPTRGRGWCSKHYQRWKTYGDPNKLLRAGSGEAVAEFFRLAALETDECVLWPFALYGKGYGHVWVEGRSRPTHQFALELRVPRPHALQTLHGPSCRKSCMNYRHLRWGTAQENTDDRRSHGIFPLGSACHNSRLTEDQVREIRALYADGLTQAAVGAMFGVARVTVAAIVRRENWGWLT